MSILLAPVRATVEESYEVVFTGRGAARRKTPFFRGTAIEIDFRPTAGRRRRVEEVL